MLPTTTSNWRHIMEFLLRARNTYVTCVIDLHCVWFAYRALPYFWSQPSFVVWDPLFPSLSLQRWVRFPIQLQKSMWGQDRAEVIHVLHVHGHTSLGRNRHMTNQRESQELFLSHHALSPHLNLRGYRDLRLQPTVPIASLRLAPHRRRRTNHRERKTGPWFPTRTHASSYT